ncbi:MAG: response regulator [Candidatus Thorarchaeota archaeon]|nr:response regulator [Candidatus Thorarchaeota archaeon]
MRSIRVLLIEDSEDDALLIERNLKKGGLDPEIFRVADADALSAALDDGSWDVILCDYMMPGFSADYAFEIIKSHGLDIPFILVSGTIPDEVAVKLMRRGVHDYILKENLARLPPAIIREIDEAQERLRKRQAEAALKESEQRYRLLVHSITDTVLILDDTGHVKEIYSKGTIIPQTEGPADTHLSDLFSADLYDNLQSLVDQVQKNRSDVSIEFVTSVQRSPRWILAIGIPYEDEKHIVVFLRDMTELRKIEAQKRAADRSASLYLDLLSHDIRNHLQAILINAELLEDDFHDPKVLDVVKGIRDSINKCTELIDSVQSSETLLEAPLQEIEINPILVECMEQIATTNENVIIESHILVSHARIQADSFIKTAFMNIIDNAVRHNPKDNPRVWVSLRELRDGFEVTISDNGSGIPDEQKNLIFDPSARSSGVGIHQAVQIIEKYGGRIEVLDRVQGDYTQGCAFRIWLPKISSGSL